jgi:TolB-like protein
VNLAVNISTLRKAFGEGIMAELIKVDDGFQLWSETYDPQIGDIFSVQDEIARAVTGALP